MARKHTAGDGPRVITYERLPGSGRKFGHADDTQCQKWVMTSFTFGLEVQRPERGTETQTCSINTFARHRGDVEPSLYLTPAGQLRLASTLATRSVGEAGCSAANSSSDPGEASSDVGAGPPCLSRSRRWDDHEIALAMAKAAAAARPPITAVWRALRAGRAPVKRPLMYPKIRRATTVIRTDVGSADFGLPRRT
jgi:hypothetical protein